MTILYSSIPLIIRLISLQNNPINWINIILLGIGLSQLYPHTFKIEIPVRDDYFHQPPMLLNIAQLDKHNDQHGES